MTNSLFMLGMALLLGGLKHHEQEYNRATARLQAGLMFLAAVALLIPSLVGGVERRGRRGVHAAAQHRPGGDPAGRLRARPAVLAGHAQGRSSPARRTAPGDEEHLWPVTIAAALLLAVTVVVALVSEIFVESVQYAASEFGMTPAFVGFIIVSIVGAAAEMMAAFTAARKNRLDMSVGIALGSSAQIALFVAPVLVLLSLFIAPVPMDLQFWPGAVVAVLIEHARRRVRHQQRSLGVVRRRDAARGLRDLRAHAVPDAARHGLIPPPESGAAAHDGPWAARTAARAEGHAAPGSADAAGAAAPEQPAPGIRRQVRDRPAGGGRLRQDLAARAMAQGGPADRARSSPG